MADVDITQDQARKLIAEHHVVEVRIPEDSSYWIDFVLGNGQVLGMADAGYEEPRSWYLQDG